MPIFITQKITTLKGSVGNTEWWTDEDWNRHNAYVEKLKTDGEYLKPEEMNVTIVHHPLFDGPIENYKNNPNYTVEEK